MVRQDVIRNSGENGELISGRKADYNGKVAISISGEYPITSGK